MDLSNIRGPPRSNSRPIVAMFNGRSIIRRGFGGMCRVLYDFTRLPPR